MQLFGQARLLALASLGFVLCGLLCAEDALPWSSDLAASQAASARDGRPLMVLIRREWDVASLDAGHWVREPGGALGALLARFHRAMVWQGDAALDAYPFAPQDGFLFLTPQGEPIAIEEAPAERAQLPGLLEDVLRWPRSVDQLAREAGANLADRTLARRAITVLRKTGRSDHALELYEAALRAGTRELLDEGIDLRQEALVHAAERLGRVAEVLKRVKDASDGPLPPAAELRDLISALTGTVGGETPDPALHHAAIGASEALSEWSRNGGEAGRFVKRVVELLPLLNARASALRKQSDEMQRQYVEKYPFSLLGRLSELRDLLRESARKPDDAEKARAIADALLKRPLNAAECRRAAPLLTYAVATLRMEAARRALAQKLEKEAPRGRVSAEALLDLADLAYANGAAAEADDYWKAAEAAAGGGESATLYRTARAMRDLACAKDSPRRGPWAERGVLDVLVLAPDLQAYAAAISAWTRERFFPVLMQDDLYAPKFAEAFQPRHVVVLPAAGTATLSQDEMRRCILSSWSKAGVFILSSARPGYRELFEARERVGGDPEGVVFTDGESGEVAGALALAAGRFQGLEFLPVPMLGEGAERRRAQPEDHLHQDIAWSLAAQVQEGLARWKLPFKDRWAAVTLCGAYPYRWRGAQHGRWGSSYALDDLLGRDEDRTRVAVTGRLIGDHARSAYQAMCSLFLRPDSALLFNTYGTDPKTIWGQYRMDYAEREFSHAGLATAHVADKDAQVDAFREKLLPWNRFGLVVVNSSGGSASWSVHGGGGTSDDFPLGGPCAMHVTHSGTASDLYNPDSLAGRALWGGAYFYYGSTAEPFLSSFQPSSYFAPRIVRGAPLASAFRQRTGQNFWQPWRLTAVGDPLFCLRRKPAAREAWHPRKALVMRGERIIYGEGAADFPDALRRSRWSGNRHSAYEFVRNAKTLPASDLPMYLDEFLRNEDPDGALRLWRSAGPQARANYDARVLARYAAGRLMDEARAWGDFAMLLEAFAWQLTTAPARNHLERWMSVLREISREQDRDAELEAWLEARLAEESVPHRSVLVSQLSGLKAEALYALEVWSRDDAAQALRLFGQAVRSTDNANGLKSLFLNLIEAYTSKFAGATAELLEAQLRWYFVEGSAECERIEPLLEELALRRTLHKDWLILGPFYEHDAAPQEKVLASANNLGAVFAEKDRTMAWQRPFAPQTFGIVDLFALLKPERDGYGYAAAEVRAAHDTAGLLLLGSDTGVTVWLDGKRIHRKNVDRGVRIDEDRVSVRLTKGVHRLVLRIEKNGRSWGFCVRFADEQGRAPLAGVTLRCPVLPVADME